LNLEVLPLSFFLTDFTEAEREHVGQELSDVFLYLIRMSEKCHIDLPTAVLKKMQQNEKKYPAKTVYGKSDKYTEYVQNGAAVTSGKEEFANKDS